MLSQTPQVSGISLCMIVKNEAASLKRALASVRELVSEMVVVDTGSSDETKQIATAAGARVFDYPWHDDFASARNFSLKQATRDWILVLDADEVIARRDHAELRRVIAENRHQGVWFYQRNYFEDPAAENWCVNQTDYEEAKGFAGYSDVPVIRLFRRCPEIYYEGIVHESVDDSMTGMKVHYSDIPIHHFRSDSFRSRSPEKQERYFKLLKKAYEEDPFSVKTCFLLGRQCYELGRYPEAVAYLEQAVSLGTRSELIFENLGAAYYQCGMHEETVGALERVIAFNPRYAEGFATIALSYYEIGQTEKAINSLVKAINLRPTSVRYHFNLAAMYYRESDWMGAKTQLDEAIRLAPKFTRNYYLLFHVLLNLNQTAEALEISRILRQFDPLLYQGLEEKVRTLEAAMVQEKKV